MPSIKSYFFGDETKSEKAPNGPIRELQHSFFGGEFLREKFISPIGAPDNLSITKDLPSLSYALIGSPYSLNFSVSGNDGDLSFAWYIDGNEAAEVGDTLSFGDVNSSVDGEKIYAVATDKAGNSVTSRITTMKAYSALALNSQPSSTIQVQAGDNVTASVTPVDGVSPYSYQWAKNGTKIQGATNSSITLSNVTENQNGDQYQVTVTDAIGNEIKSTNSAIVITKPLAFTTQPSSSVSAAAGATVTVGPVVVSGGVGLLQYSWFIKPKGSNATQIQGDYTSITTEALTSADDGAEVYCVVNDIAGHTITSESCTITVTS